MHIVPVFRQNGRNFAGPFNKNPSIWGKIVFKSDVMGLDFIFYPVKVKMKCEWTAFGILVFVDQPKSGAVDIVHAPQGLNESFDTSGFPCTHFPIKTKRFPFNPF